MHAYVATLTELPGHIQIIATDSNHAAQLLRDWYRIRFNRSPAPYSCQVEGVHVAWPRDQVELQALADAELAGIAYWTTVGWVALPPDVEAPGPVYREPQATHGYDFAGSREDGRTILFASNLRDAWSIYRVWAELHDRQHERVFRIKHLTPGVDFLRNKQLMEAMDLGITGVASKRIGGWDILPPYDAAAGDN